MSHKVCVRKLAVLVAFLVGCILITISYTSNSPNLESIEKAHTNVTHIQLENILTAINQPRKDRNVFFIDSTHMNAGNNKVQHNVRQACSVESAARTNPDLEIFLLVVARKPMKVLERTKVLDVLLSISNVHINYLDIEEFSEGTPLEAFIASGELYNSTYIIEHTSDVLRLLVLWKYGGTYSDLDMIFRKDIDDVKPNFACADTPNNMNGAFFNFQHDEGHKLNEIFLTELNNTYNGASEYC